MANIPHVELTDTINQQRERLNLVIDAANASQKIVGGNGISVINGVTSVKTSGDGLSFDEDGNLVGNDAYPNLMTQVVLSPDSPAPVPATPSALSITFPEFSVIFGSKIYYGKQIGDFVQVNVPETTMNVEAGADGPVYVYVDTAGDIQQSSNPISPENSATQCLLGSYYRLSNKIQFGTWAYTPWNGATSRDNRFADSTSLNGGLLHPTKPNEFARDPVNILKEGINVSTSVYNPNTITWPAVNTWTAKALYKGYSASTVATSTIDTTHIYNITSGTLDDISGQEGYIILIPGIVSVTGQDVYLMAMSTKSGNKYKQIYPTMEEAVSGIYSMEVSIGNIASRVAWLGQSIVVKIGATDYTDIAQLQIVGQVPNVLGNYSNTPGHAQPVTVEGLTIKNEGRVIGDIASKNTINFTGGFTLTNTSQNEVEVTSNTSAASQDEVNTGTESIKYVTPETLKNNNYLASIDYVGRILQQNQLVSWPTESSISSWPHTLCISISSSTYTIPNITPTYTDKILTWEVLLKNTTSTDATITWPSTYKPFNGETLVTTIPANSTVFMMMRKYSNAYTLVSNQGTQLNSEY